MSQEIAEIAEKKRCPGLNNCGHIKSILSRDFPFEEIYAMLIREMCRGCPNEAK